VEGTEGTATEFATRGVGNCLGSRGAARISLRTHCVLRSSRGGRVAKKATYPVARLEPAVLIRAGAHRAGASTRRSLLQKCSVRGAARIRTGDGGFAVLCLTTWPRRLKKNETGRLRAAVRGDSPSRKSGKPDSNRRPPPWQGGALPTELFPQHSRQIRETGRLLRRQDWKS